MAEWVIDLYRVEHAVSAVRIGNYLVQNLDWEIRNSEPGATNFELALSQTWRENELLSIGRDSFGPYRTDFYLWRWSGSQSRIITAGHITSINLNKDRDTILVGGKDWLHYLERRIYPFIPEDFTTYNPSNPDMYIFGGTLGDRPWPKRYNRDLQGIVADMLTKMLNVQTADGYFGPLDSQSLQVIPPSTPTGIQAKYGPIYPGDTTTIFDHIRSLAEMKDGFEFDIMPLSLEFKMWSPRRDPGDGVPMYILTPSDFEVNGQIIDFDWTNEGPDGTFLIGLGTGNHKIARSWNDPESTMKYRWLDKTYDFGSMSDPDLILQKIQDQDDLYPQKKLGLTLLNPEFLSPSFYSTSSGPRNRLGAQIRVVHDFDPYHKVNAQFRINSIQGNVSNATNESITLELEMVYDPGTHGTTSSGFQLPE